MRKNRDTEERLVAVLRDGDRTSVEKASKKHKAREPMISRKRHTLECLTIYFAGAIRTALLPASRILAYGRQVLQKTNPNWDADALQLHQILIFLNWV
jgi:hypothetical protein